MSNNNLRLKQVECRADQIFVGYDVNNTPVVIDMAKSPHILVNGVTGSGKYKLLDTMISNHIVNSRDNNKDTDTNNNVELYLCQMDRANFSIYRGCEEVKGYRDDLNDIKNMFEDVVSRIRQRQEIIKPLIKTNKGDNLSDYNRYCFENELPHMYVIIDEYKNLINGLYDSEEVRERKSVINDYICEILQYGKMVGCYLIIGTQRWIENTVSPFARNIIGNRISIGIGNDLRDDNGYKAVLNNGFEEIEFSIPDVSSMEVMEIVRDCK